MEKLFDESIEFLLKELKNRNQSEDWYNIARAIDALSVSKLRHIFNSMQGMSRQENIVVKSDPFFTSKS